MKVPMRELKTARPHNQQGMTLITIVLGLALMTTILLIIIKLAPAYANNMALKNSIEGTMASNDVTEMSLARFRTEAMKSIIVNGIRDFDSQNIKYTSEGSFRYIDINYETRIHIFYNIDVVLSFENRFDRY